MSPEREARDYLYDILQSIADCRLFISGMSYDQFCADRKTVNAVIRSLEIAGMRDKLIHEYFGVDLEIVRETMRNDLTPLDTAIRKSLKETE